MKALVHKYKKGMDGLHYEETKNQELKKEEVRIKLHFAGLNHRDLFTIAQHDENAEPLIIGSDGVGEISEILTENKNFKVGDKVIINPGLNWIKVSDAAPENLEILGNPVSGTFAEEIILPIENIVMKPEYLSMEEASVLSLSALTAYRALFTKGNVTKDDTILIPGIGGGVATYLLQFAKAIGASVYVTSRSKDKLEQAKKLGANKGIQSEGDWNELLKEEKVDVVIETVGAATFHQSLNQLRKGGTMVLIGSSTGDKIEFNLREFFYGQYTLKGTTMGSSEEYQAMLDFIGKHNIRPVVDKIFKIEDFKKAFDRLEKGKQFGKIGFAIS
ncbi:zinc-dependent alcohol dehydrogenase family protein [Carnobacterium funditum]|uniref:zinc-dependent alcohol dehydrogenase family protein n=1 Tax=Carnobacterium funditum TaxID=2752 RepID=UPI000558731B|nr:NAD(P)-dependent alcohol dehydrogenase [Carnobacterium funditum]